LGKPETFDLLGFTHICAKSRNGRFWVKRVTVSKRMRAKLKEVTLQLRQLRYLPIPSKAAGWPAWCAGTWPTTPCPANAFRTQVTGRWHKALRRRSQKTRINWERMNRIAAL
jgi:RNA-directed DNA polymerase